MVLILVLATIQSVPPTPPEPVPSVPMAVRARVVQTCVLSASGPICGGSRDAPPQIKREPGRIVYTF